MHTDLRSVLPGSSVTSVGFAGTCSQSHPPFKCCRQLCDRRRGVTPTPKDLRQTCASRLTDMKGPF